MGVTLQAASKLLHAQLLCDLLQDVEGEGQQQPTQLFCRWHGMQGNLYVAFSEEAQSACR